MQTPNQKRPDTEEALNRQFTEIAEKLAMMLQNEGLKTQASLNGLSYFSQLTTQQKEVAIEKLSFYHDLCHDHVVEDCSLRDSKRFTWRALVKLGLSPTADFLEALEDGDIVEIYDAQQVQVFRNLDFFDFCSYTLEELFTLEWWRLFKRDEDISKKILDVASEIYQKKHPIGITDPVPEHLVIEELSKEKTKLEFFIKQLSPLYQKHQVAALICVERASFI